MNWNYPHRVKNEFITQINGISITLKREDTLHPKISGNKFRKLKYNFLAYDKKKYNGVATFGGAYSNHLVATAAAGKQMGIPTFGFVRGEELSNKKRNPSLAYCEANGMKLFFLSREEYREKKQNSRVIKYLNDHKWFCLEEGGTNDLAIQGCTEILQSTDACFDTICCAVGTGGTFLGLLSSIKSTQHVVGWDVVNDTKVKATIEGLATVNKQYDLISSIAMGGYGRATNELVDFINDFYKNYNILLDPIYTGKLLFGIFAMIKKGEWRWGQNVLIIHTGGLQGIEGFNQKQKQLGRPCIIV
jgi:1-aminocyclopropane-1-carboxylate deaminase